MVKLEVMLILLMTLQYGNSTFDMDKVTFGTYSNTENKIELKVSLNQDSEVTRLNISNRTEDGRGIQGSEFIIEDLEVDSNSYIGVTDSHGMIEVEGLKVGRPYRIQQRSVHNPYELISEAYDFTPMTVSELNFRAINRIDTFAFDKGFAINVPVVKQNPELPNGCEITALTSVLNFYGYKVSKEVMADKYLPKEPLVTRDGRLYGPDPNVSYAGNPRETTGRYCYTAPLIAAGEKYLRSRITELKFIDLTTSTSEEIIDRVNNNIPVIIWVTIGMEPLNMSTGWYRSDTQEYNKAPNNLHCVVLTGANEDQVFVMDPLRGKMTYDRQVFFDAYQSLGSWAMMLN